MIQIVTYFRVQYPSPLTFFLYWLKILSSASSLHYIHVCKGITETSDFQYCNLRLSVFLYIRIITLFRKPKHTAVGDNKPYVVLWYMKYVRIGLYMILAAGWEIKLHSHKKTSTL